MKVRCTLVGIMDTHRTLEWPEGWPVPRVGESVDFGNYNLYVRTVVWFPEGEDGSEPFVYVVIGQMRQ